MPEIISESEKIELLSEEVQEIMGQTPKWLVRWGITVFFLVLLLIIAGSFVFKYPDVITSTVVIISENPPASIVAHTNGKIDNLLVQNEKKVIQGEILAMLENTAHYIDIKALKTQLAQSSFLRDTDLVYHKWPENYVLGPVQASYSNFQKQYQEYWNYLTLQMHQKKIVSIQQQLSDYSTYLQRLNTQAYNQEKAVQLTYKQFKRDSSLYIGNVIAIADFEKSEQTYLQVKNAYQSLLASISNTQMQVNQLNFQIVDQQTQKNDQRYRLFNSLKEAYNNLCTTIAEWEKLYLLVSPIEGTVTFTKYWSKNQFVSSGDIVFTVVPNKAERIIGRVNIPIAGSGKVKKGQMVHIQLANFPFTEFGMLEGKIESISLIAESNQNGAFYTSEVSLPKGLTTNYKKVLAFNQEMTGVAEIITEDMSLFERFINPIKAVLKKQ